MLSLFFVSIVSITFSLSRASQAKQGHKMLCADGTVQLCHTFDMLVSSDVAQIYGLTDWP